MTDAHMHMVLDSLYWKAAIDRHRERPREDWVRSQLDAYRNAGFTWLRDGGDRWGVGALARSLAPEYGITYLTPLSPLHRLGHYGGFIGTGYGGLREYTELVKQQKRAGADFIKVMVSGLMDFDRFGVLTEPGLPPEEIRELVNIAHGEGLPLMAHCNGAKTMLAAARAGADSIEHGAYPDGEALSAMAENKVLFVPTLSTVGNLRGTGRFDEGAVAAILETALENTARFAALGGLLAPGTDAGAWSVPHGVKSEYALLAQALGPGWETTLDRGIAALKERFAPHDPLH